MTTVRLATILGALITPGLLAVVSATGGLGLPGWLTGLAAGWIATGLLVGARYRRGESSLPPADWVTLARALLAAGVAALVGDWLMASASRPEPVVVLVTISTIALILDAVDGQVARRTGTASSLGGRLDGEVDAFLILLLSVAVTLRYGNLASWVLVIGAARYLFLLAGYIMPWLAAPLPPRFWRKVVAAVQGIVLTVAVSGLLNPFLALIAAAGALALLAESFGRDIVWLFRRGAGAVTRRVVQIGSVVVSIAIVWGALVLPDRLSLLSPVAFVRVPVEALVLVAICMFLPPRVRRIVAAVAGVLIGLLAIVKVLDIGFFVEVDRAFNPVVDWSNLQPAVGVVRDSIGQTATDTALAVLAVALVLVFVIITAATVRITSVAARYRRPSGGGIATLGVLWVVTAILSVQLVPGDPLAAYSSAGVAVAQVRDAASAVRDQQRFEGTIRSADAESQVPASDLLTGLRGKDVLIVFVESYGQVAVRGSSFSPGVDAVLSQGDATLAQAGFSAQSAWLTSPTFGGISWLAHSTLQSGLWVNSQQRYNQLVASTRFTLSDAFKEAGWRTVCDDPTDGPSWPQGTSFYHYDTLYNSTNVGYKGPAFSYAKIPDQYTLNEFGQMELAPGHSPVMAEIDLVSSHTPWTPLPQMVPWDSLGDGSIYNPMPAQGLTPTVAWQSDATVQRLYGQSIQYSLQALTEWVARINDPNLVMIMLGDHEPATVVSGDNPTHSVPVSIIAADPDVFSRIADWHWQPGLQPSPTAPLEQMDAFRNQFLDAFNSPQT